MPSKEIRINDRRFEVYDWSETFAAESTGRHIVGSFKVTLPEKVEVGSLVQMEGEGADRYGVVQWIGPADDLGSALGEFMVRGSLIKGDAPSTEE
jgi:hypothetical protein